MAADGLRGVDVPVPDDVPRAGRPGERGLLGRAHRGEDGSAAPAGELDRGVPERAGTPGHQHGAPVERARREAGGPVLGDGQTAVRGHGGDAEAGPRVQADARRQRDRVPGRHDRELLRATAAPLAGRLPEPHPLTDAGGIDARPDGVDDPGGVLERDDRVASRVPPPVPPVGGG
ncbi:hypothetical protein [Pseudonocardia ailaonensis]|uniref:hypothetical protein n=1 Tax=Pseudonocardia ailaonensis TaxID=367279 RepID=UPI0031E3291B